MLSKFNWQILRTNDNLHYCEGFATHEELGLIIAHAWLVNDRCEVFDPTWLDSQSFINPVYFCVVFNWEFVMAVAAKTDKRKCMEF